MYTAPAVSRCECRHLVVQGGRRGVTLPPAAPELDGADNQDQDEDRVRVPEGERDEPGQAHGPERRVDSGHGAASVERNDGEQIEEVEEEAREGERDQKRGVERLAEAPDDHRAEGAEDRAGERDARFLPGIRRHLLHPDDGPEEGDEERRRSRHALAAELEDVAELVHEDEKDEADGEPPAPDPRIGRDRDEHRSRGREDLELEEREREELELRKEGADLPRAARSASSRSPSSGTPDGSACTHAAAPARRPDSPARAAE